MRVPTTFVLALLVSAALAGCVGGDAEPADTMASTAPAPSFADGAGSITGLVTNEEAQPLPMADVAVKGPAEAAAQADGEGRFTFNDLPAGSYQVFAQRLGYESVSRKVTVEVGQSASVDLILRALAVEEPRVETSTYTGFMDGDVYTAGIGLYYPRTLPINMTRGATEVVSTAQWDSTVPVFARYLRVILTYEDARMRKDGRSPVTVNITDFEVGKDKSRAIVDWGVAFGCPAPAGNPTGFANCVPGNPDAVVPQIAYQQRVNFYNNVFYYQRAPEGFTGLG